MVRDANLRACEARVLHTRGSRLRPFAPSENVRKRLFCSLSNTRWPLFLHGSPLLRGTAFQNTYGIQKLGVVSRRLWDILNCPRPGLEPGPLARSALTITPLHTHKTERKPRQIYLVFLGVDYPGRIYPLSSLIPPLHHPHSRPRETSLLAQPLCSLNARTSLRSLSYSTLKLIR